METYLLFFPNANHVSYLVFCGELKTLEDNDFEVILSTIQRRGVQNTLDVLSVLGKGTYARRKTIIGIIKAMTAASISVVQLTQDPGIPLINIQMENNQVILTKEGTEERVTLDSSNVEHESDKIDSLVDF